jgi:hypothetical protein
VCLDVTEECLQHIRKVRDNLSLRDFYARYGDLFARRVQLGGRLTCSEAKHADGESSSKDQASKFKATAQASISGSFAQASFKASHEQQKNTSKEDKSQNLAVNMAWEATGGDTLLCNKLRLTHILLFNKVPRETDTATRVALLSGALLLASTPTGGSSM